MIIVRVDNFDRDYIPESVIETGLSAVEAQAKCDKMNEGHPGGEWFFVVRPEGAKIRTLSDIYGPCSGS